MMANGGLWHGCARAGILTLGLLLAACGTSSTTSPYSQGSTHTTGARHRHRAAHHHHHYHHSTSAAYAGYGASGSYTSRGPQPPSKPLGPRSKTRGCVVHDALPDSACTPGSVFVGATKAKICVLGYSRRVRNVSSSTKRQAYREYGITSHARGEYEVDHLVSLELGGSNSIANLWPEAASPTPGFHEKDAVENYLHSQVCNGSIGLAQAQHEIATNWLAVQHSMPH